MRPVILGCVLWLAACADTGQERVRVPLYLAGTDLSDPIQTRDGSTLEIDSAQLAFGPLYLCAGNTAGELCDTARLEWLGSHVVDLTTAAAEPVGELEGVSGPVRSWMYDLGISSQLTRAKPFVLDAAQALGGVSLQLQGHTELDGVKVPFDVEVAIAQSDETELGVPVVRKSAGDGFQHDVQPAESGLLVRFDAEPWLSSIDLHAYREQSVCAPSGPEHACAQGVEHTCTSAGEIDSSRDCAPLGQVCLTGAGCSEALHFELGSEPYRTLRTALLVGARPSFEWGFSE